jgi:hypothetical protein
MVLQYVAATFHLPSVSTVNINKVQYSTPHQQYETPTIPAVVISKVLLPQSNIKAAFVHSTAITSLMSLQACQHTPNLMSQNSVVFRMSISPQMLRHFPSLSKYHITTLHSIPLMPSDPILYIVQIFGENSNKMKQDISFKYSCKSL